MIFLNPAVLFGLLAASIPVLIHLLNLRKLKRVDFSTLAFLKELQKNKIRKIKLKQWLLMALRMGIILFLVTAFARPTLKGTAIGGTASAAKTTAVFILDNTPSMSVVDAKGSYFNQAKAAINELLGQLQEGDDAALILVGDVRDDKIKTTNDLARFRKEVDDARISDASGYLNNALIKAAQVMGNSDNFNKEVYILSDFQSGRLFKQGDISNLGHLLNDKVRLYTFNYSGKSVYNIGIDNLKVNTQIFEQNKPVDFGVTVTNYSNQPVSNLVVSLYINNQRSAQQSVTLNPGESKILSMESAVNATGYVDVYAEIEDDEVAADNKRYTNIFIPKEIPVGIFAENEADAKFVDLALNAGSNGSTLKITSKSLSQLSSLDLSQFDVIILIGSKGFNSGERLRSFLASGGGVFLMPGSSGDLQSFRKLTSSLKLPSPTLSAGKINDTGNPVRFDKIDFENPVFHNIFAHREKKSVESPEIYYYYKIFTEGRGRSIISLADGSSFLGEYKSGKGKIFLMNTSPVLSWSTFPLKSIFAPLMSKSVYYLASKDRTESDYLAGSTVNINLSGNTSPQIKIRKPDGNVDFINLQDSGGSSYLKYDETVLTGNYKVFGGDKIIDEFTVNPDPRESVTKYIGSKEFEDYLNKIGFKGKYINIEKNQDPAKIVMQSRFGSELWKYFILIAIILAVIEMTVARNAKKDLTGV